MFEDPTYVVLELPANLAGAVRELRARYDRRLAAYPVEITLAGSSGIGPLAGGQDVASVRAAFERVAGAHLPLRSRFAAISRFASGPVVWLQPADPAPFEVMQRALVAAGIAFLPHRYSYTPHCSLCSRPLPPDRLACLLAAQFPRQEFELSSLALYAVAAGHPRLLTRFPASVC